MRPALKPDAFERDEGRGILRRRTRYLASLLLAATCLSGCASIKPTACFAPLLTNASSEQDAPQSLEPPSACAPSLVASVDEEKTEKTGDLAPDVVPVTAEMGKGAAISLVETPFDLLMKKKAEASVESEGIVTDFALAEAPKAIVTGTIAPKASVDSLGAATSAALSTSNALRAQDARIDEASAGVDLAATALNPTLDLSLTSGPAHITKMVHEDPKPENKADARLEATVSLRQLVYDFGATERDVARAGFIRSSEVASLDDQSEDLAFRVANAYLNVIEGRALLSVVDDTIASHQRLASIIRANEREGNGTAADVNRVSARLVDINAIRSDITLAMQAGEEEFFRLTGRKPDRLAPVPLMGHALPRHADAAMVLAGNRNPRLASLKFVSRSLDEERASQELGTRPKVEFQFDGVNTNSVVQGGEGSSNLEARATVSVRYRFWDGGVSEATNRQIEARRIGTDENFADQRRTLESEIRQAYRAIEAAKNKGQLLRQGVSTSDNVQDLYLEQFKAGQRTVFELLDTQMSSFTARRSAVEARFDGERATLVVLRAIGSVRSAIATAKPGKGDMSFVRPTKKRVAALDEAITDRVLNKASAKTDVKPKAEKQQEAKTAPANETSQQAKRDALAKDDATLSTQSVQPKTIKRLRPEDDAPPPPLGHAAAVK
jgi:outer membrane protein, adhesin transport system